MSEVVPGPRLELEFPAKREYVRTARLAAAAFARVQDASESLVEDFKLAVSEACSQAVVANAATGGDAAVRVVARADGRTLAAEVFDRGGGPDTLSTTTTMEAPTADDLGSPSALAFPLIRGVVDDLDVASREGGGSVVRMTLVMDASEGPGS